MRRDAQRRGKALCLAQQLRLDYRIVSRGSVAMGLEGFVNCSNQVSVISADGLGHASVV